MRSLNNRSFFGALYALVALTWGPVAPHPRFRHLWV
ncbi:MAG: hypothetical protein ACI8PT_002483 [Gammaproteobacteria bacterium]|jgi:hypothetical protein